MNAHIAVQRKKPDFMWGGSPKDVVKHPGCGILRIARERRRPGGQVELIGQNLL
jgi:hypothetical protein